MFTDVGVKEVGNLVCIEAPWDKYDCLVTWEKSLVPTFFSIPFNFHICVVFLLSTLEESEAQRTGYAYHGLYYSIHMSRCVYESVGYVGCIIGIIWHRVDCITS